MPKYEGFKSRAGKQKRTLPKTYNAAIRPKNAIGGKFYARTRKSSGGGSGGTFLRNIIILAAIVAAIVFLKNGGMDSVKDANPLSTKTNTEGFSFFPTRATNERAEREENEEILRERQDWIEGVESMMPEGAREMVNMLRGGAPEELKVVSVPKKERDARDAEEAREAAKAEKERKAKEDVLAKTREREEAKKIAEEKAKKAKEEDALAKKKALKETTAKKDTKPATTKKREQSGEEKAKETPKAPATTQPEKAERGTVKVATTREEVQEKPKRTITLYFAKHDDTTGTMRLAPLTREITVSPTIRESLNLLLQGPTGGEQSKEYITCIPRNAVLLDAYLDGDTAYLNFNQAFEYNSYGHFGFLVQIWQIVGTVTQFRNVNGVVFLIDGKKKDVIGAEGLVENTTFTRFSGQKVIKAE